MVIVVTGDTPDVTTDDPENQSLKTEKASAVEMWRNPAETCREKLRSSEIFLGRASDDVWPC
jgi:hypothetical protein